MAIAVVAGGALGPALLVLGLARVEASTASILLNLELVATVVLAGCVLRRAPGSPRGAGGRVDHRRRACCWRGRPADRSASERCSWRRRVPVGALDNCVTARIEHLSPESVVLAKGAVAGSVNVLLGSTVASEAGLVAGRSARSAAALAIGAAGYGLSITWWVKGARDLGRPGLRSSSRPRRSSAPSARGRCWATRWRRSRWLAVALAAIGVWLSIDSAHGHAHRHEPTVHEHEHTHPDEHHDHDHDGNELESSAGTATGTPTRSAGPRAPARARPPPPPPPQLTGRVSLRVG